MTRLDDYRRKLKELDDWMPFLMKNSGLPGPRGNLELAQAAAELASAAQVETFLSIPAERALENSAQVFVVVCGVTALGKMAARGEHDVLRRLRGFASDVRWRVREAVAIALQYVGDADMQRLLKEMDAWSGGNWYEKRAAGAALAEPRLLKDPASARAALRLFDKITQDIESPEGPRDESFKVLRQSMGYCWSVAVAALPNEGKALMEKWLASKNPDVQWIMKENMKKSRLSRMDARWVDGWRHRLEKKR
jgi:hypothetical protein